MSKKTLTGARLPKLYRRRMPNICTMLPKRRPINSINDKTLNALGEALGLYRCKINVGVDWEEYEILTKTARLSGASIIGYSATSSHEEYRSLFRSPSSWIDEIIYTNRDLDARNNLMIEQADAMLVLGRPDDYLKTFTQKISGNIRVIGFLSSSITSRDVEHVRQYLTSSQSAILYDSQAKSLMRRMVSQIT